MPRDTSSHADVPALTVEEADAALVAAREDGLDDVEVALLWAARGQALGLPLRTEYLPFLLGVSADRASEIAAVLVDRGHIVSA